MIILIAGATHTGKTALAARLIEKHRFPCLSIDHLKMGLIRSGNTCLTPMDDEKLVPYLWGIVREMIKTAIENGQNMIIEGCYIPFDFMRDFSPEYQKHIVFRCLVMTEEYIESRFDSIKKHASVIEKRLDDSGLSKAELISENRKNLEQCKKFGCDYILIDGEYNVSADL